MFNKEVYEEICKKAQAYDELKKVCYTWIPIIFVNDGYDNYTYTSEMPSNGQDILITDVDGDVLIDRCEIDKYGDYCIHSGNEFANKVKAWMPLPTPYKKEE